MIRYLVQSFVLLAALSFTPSVIAQTVEKVADFTFSNQDGVGVGGYDALDRFTQVGTNLWFTTAKGGTFDAGTISRFDLVTRQIVQVASLDNDTGKAAEGSLLVIENEGYFTTLNGGVGNKGTIAKINLDTGNITTLFHFPTNGSFGQACRGGLTRIGDELWATTSGGGALSKGTLVVYNLTNGVTTLVTNFDGTEIGGQPYEGLTKVGEAWYFTTFTGGTNSGPGVGNGAGTLGRLTFDGEGAPVISRLLSLQGGYTQFPTQNPLLVGTNSLYFTTVGPNTNPGAIVRFDIDTGTSTNVFLFNTNTHDPVLYGKQPGYNGLIEWLGELYFMTRQGGVSNLGIIARFNLASNTFTKLADLNGTGANALGSATLGYNTGTIVEEQGRSYLYFPVPRGGANTRGTIVRVSLPAPPIQSTLSLAVSNTVQLSWSGGYPPFTVEKKSDFNSTNWAPVAAGLTNRNIAVPSTGNTEFFRITGNL